MAIEFGLSRLRAYTNGIGSGVAVTTNLSGSAAVATGSVWIGGTEVQVTAASIDIASGANVNTGNMKIFAYLAAGQSSTATLGFLTANAPAFSNPEGTAIAIISDGAFGASTGIFSATNGGLSGLTGARAFGRAQNVTVNITYDNVMARGGTLVFANDQKLFNGNIEGSLEYAEISGANLVKLYNGVWASGGGGSGTWTLTATQAPLPFMIEARQVSNGVTGTIRLLKCFSNSLTLNIDRENYLIPSLNFVAIANQEGDIMTWTI